MTFGLGPSINHASCTMHMCLVAQFAFFKSICRMECLHPDGRNDPVHSDGRKGPIEACMSECQRNMLVMHHWSSTSKKEMSQHNGMWHLTTDSPQLQPMLTTCQTFMQMNGPRCLEPAPTRVNRMMKLKNPTNNLFRRSEEMLRTIPLMKKKHFDNKC